MLRREVLEVIVLAGRIWEGLNELVCECTAGDHWYEGQNQRNDRVEVLKQKVEPEPGQHHGSVLPH